MFSSHNDNTSWFSVGLLPHLFNLCCSGFLWTGYPTNSVISLKATPNTDCSQAESFSASHYLLSHQLLLSQVMPHSLYWLYVASSHSTCNGSSSNLSFFVLCHIIILLWVQRGNKSAVVELCCLRAFLQERFVEWDATEAACLVVRGIQEIKKQSRGQSFTMLHFIEVFKGNVCSVWYYA